MQRRNSFFLNDEQGKKIELFIQCRRLQKNDILSKSDPYVIIKLQKSSKASDNSSSTNWIEIGRTSVISDNLNPNFTDSFIVEYLFEEYQLVLAEVWDFDSPTKSSFIGKAEFSLGELVRQRNQTLNMNLSDLNNKIEYNSQKMPKLGSIIIRYDEVFLSNDICLFSISTQRLDVSFFTKLFVRIYRITESNKEPLLVYESTKSQSGRGFYEKIIKLKGQKLCNTDYNVPIIFELWSSNMFSSESLVGSCQASIVELKDQLEKFQDNQTPISYSLKNKGQSSTQNGRPIGQLLFHKAQTIQLPSFLDYLRCGTSINLVLGIDFTGSNKDPSDPQSLHYFDKSKINKNMIVPLNSYEKAIKAVGDIVIEYDQDKLVPTYGFGAEINGKISHAFPIYTGKGIQGIDNVIQEYRNLLTQNIVLSGPTYFAPLIEKVIQKAQDSINEKNDDYFILLILTDGQIHDMDQTKRLIIDSARLPISIIIIGVGNDDFKSMIELDGDEGLQDSRGKKAIRDLVQFVSFNKLEGNNLLLQKEVLHELPDQIVEYYLLNNRLPQGFEYQNNVNYIDFTRIVKEDQFPLKKPEDSPQSFLITSLIVVAIGILIMNILF